MGSWLRQDGQFRRIDGWFRCATLATSSQQTLCGIACAEA
jgi:hypothetical protein